MNFPSADVTAPPALPAALERGPAPERAGIVFVHGMRTSSAIWERQVDHVRDAGHDAVAVDLPAHGALHRERFSMPRAFEVLDEAAGSFGADTPVVVVGLSLGGYTSLAWAARHASPSAGAARLAGVVAAGCTSDPKGKPVALFRDVAHLAVTGTTAVRRGLRDASLAWRSALTGGRSRAGGLEVAALLGDAPRPGWDIVTDALTHLAGRSSVASTRALQVPVWFVNGARDRLRLEESRHVAAADRGALVVVPDAGHDVNSDAPAAFNHVLTRALRDFARD
ncbi:alpha/beta fold hydrolase [Krasilnikoviella flava]|uniref:Lysophospholipase, alpha-beta hydrolase superfamily n=1 Tax=Krasilnikoviella flava TaxID=526729 RepID=A0A1T5JHQ2_9MICO|nr:alpha/beta hydrolase [Krasilnikoviella flava]SKC50915.1 Lysophospholipase, alpha-beta hydrolase superfamily [Krasilnikoviella flava]